MLGAVVKTLLGRPALCVRVPGFKFYFQFQFHAKARSDRQQGMTQVPGSLPLMWETQIGFQASGFVPVQPWLVLAFEEWNSG